MVLNRCCGVRGRVRPGRRRAMSATAWTSTRCWTCWTRLVRKSLVTVGARRRAHPLRAVGDHPPVRRGAAGRHRRHRPRSGIVTPAISPTRPSPIGGSGTGPASGWRWTGWTSSSPTCGPGSAGPPTKHDLRHRGGHRRPHRHAGRALQRYEPVGWAEEILEAAAAAELCCNCPVSTPPPVSAVLTGRPEEAVGYAQTAVALEADPRYDGFRPVQQRLRGRWPSVRRSDRPLLRDLRRSGRRFPAGMPANFR